MAFEIEKKTVRVTVEREFQCVSEADIYCVDTHTDPSSGRRYALLWDLSDDKLAIGYGFHGMTEDEDFYGWRYYASENYTCYDAKRMALIAWADIIR